MNLDRIAIDVEARLAAESIIGSAYVVELGPNRFNVGFDRTDGYQMLAIIEPATVPRVTHESVVLFAVGHMLALCAEQDDPNAVHAPEMRSE